MNITNVIEIMRLSDAVYESDKISIGQDVDSFKEIQDSNNPKRFVRFVCNQKHSKGQIALIHNLHTISNDDAVILADIAKEGEKFVFAEKGIISAVVVDLSKIINIDEKHALAGIIRNTMTKMRVNKLEKELEIKSAENAKIQTHFEKMQDGVKHIKEIAGKAQAGLGSRKVNELKNVIDKVVEKTK